MRSEILSKNTIKEIFKLKLQIMENIAGHMPPPVRKRLDCLGRELASGFVEAVNGYLAEKDKDTGSKKIKKVSID